MWPDVPSGHVTDDVRYDNHADWYVEFSRDWESDTEPFLPSDMSGQRVLDLCCGWGVLSRAMAGGGAEVVGVDVSARMLEQARATDRAADRAVDYRLGDATTTDWWDGRPFQGAVCAMALMDVDDLAAALATVAQVMEPGGWFVFSVFHPCFPGRSDPYVMPSWPPERGYWAEGWWTTRRDGVRGHVGANHRTLATYLNAILAAGLEFVEFAEVGDDVPTILVGRCRRPVSVARAGWP